MEELQEIAGGRSDLLAETAGILIGAARGTLDEARTRAAALCIEAGADETLIRSGWRRDSAGPSWRGSLYRSKCRDRSDLRVHGVAYAARRYSLITPPSTFRRCTGASSGTTTGSS
jgi:hypothetical protein